MKLKLSLSVPHLTIHLQNLPLTTGNTCRLSHITISHQFLSQGTRAQCTIKALWPLSSSIWSNLPWKGGGSVSGIWAECMAPPLNAVVSKFSCRFLSSVYLRISSQVTTSPQLQQWKHPLYRHRAVIQPETDTGTSSTRRKRIKYELILLIHESQTAALQSLNPLLPRRARCEHPTGPAEPDAEEEEVE